MVLNELILLLFNPTDSISISSTDSRVTFGPGVGEVDYDKTPVPRMDDPLNAEIRQQGSEVQGDTLSNGHIASTNAILNFSVFRDNFNILSHGYPCNFL